MSAVRWLVVCAQSVAVILLVARMTATIPASGCDSCGVPTCKSPKSGFRVPNPFASVGCNKVFHAPSADNVGSPWTPYSPAKMRQMRQMAAEGCDAYLDSHQQQRLRERGIVVPPSPDEVAWMQRQNIAIPTTPEGMERMRRRYHGIADGQAMPRSQQLTPEQAEYLRQVWGDAVTVNTLPGYMPAGNSRGVGSGEMLERLAGMRANHAPTPEQVMPYFGLRPLVDREPCEPRGPIAQALWNTPKPMGPVMPLPTYTTRGPRDFLYNDNPSSIGY